MQENQNLSKLIEKWPSAFVARPEIGKFSGGMLSAGTMANLDSKGLGPEGKVRVGRKVAYEVHALVRWLEARNPVASIDRMRAARRRKRNKGGAA